MAGADYLKCKTCGTRLYYMPDEVETDVVCVKCYEKLKEKYNKLYVKHYKTTKGIIK